MRVAHLSLIAAACGGSPAAPPRAPIANVAPAGDAEPDVAPAPEPAPDAAPAAAPAPAPRPLVGGGLGPGDIKQGIKAHLRAIQYCYERAVLASPGLAGKVEARFTIDGAGAVTTATATGVDPGVDACIVGVLHAITFRATGGGLVNVAYPFVFSTK